MRVLVTGTEGYIGCLLAPHLYQRGHDVARANAISDAGWTLRRFTYERVVHNARLVSESVRAALMSANRL